MESPISPPSSDVGSGISQGVQTSAGGGGAKLTRNQRYLAYLKTDHWADLRKQKFAEVGRQCANCKSKSRIHVHHIEYRELYDCATTDLAVLCEPCHDDLHSFGRLFKADLIGKPVEWIVGAIEFYRATPEHEIRKKKLEERHEKRKGPRKKDFQRRTKQVLKKCASAGYSRAAVVRLINQLTQILRDHPENELVEAVPEPPTPPTSAPNNNSVTLTKELINACRTDRGGFTNGSLACLGVKKEDFISGWVNRLIGKTIKQSSYDAALEYRNVKGKKLK